MRVKVVARDTPTDDSLALGFWKGVRLACGTLLAGDLVIATMVVSGNVAVGWEAQGVLWSDITLEPVR